MSELALLAADASAPRWIVLGVFTGAQLLLVVLSLLIANAYGERGLRVHALAMTVGIAAAWLEAIRPEWVSAALLGVMALSALHLRELTTHVGSLRPAQRWIGGAVGVLVVLAAADAATHWAWPAPAGVVVFMGLVAVIVPRAWSVSLPWAIWVALGQGALLAVAAWLGMPGVGDPPGLLVAGVLAFWSMALYLASVWRSRMFGERRWQQVAARLEDPLTGLATPLVLGQRLQTARSLMRRYGHPSTLMLVHIDELQAVTAQLGAQVAEAAALEAGLRLRGVLGPADLAARIPGSRFAVLAEGSAAPEVAANLASRVLASGLREPLHAVEGLVLHFRVVLAELPTTDASGPALLQRLGECMDADAARKRNRRIRTLLAADLLATEPLPLDEDSRTSEWMTKTN